jgi:hypothetical protein
MFVVPVTVPFSDVDCPPVSEVEVGFSVTPMVGTRAIVAVADLVGSTTLVTVNVMFCELVSDMGTL